MGMYGGIGSPSSLWRIVATSYASSNWLPENRLPDFLVLSPSSFTRPKRGQKKKKKKDWAPIRSPCQKLPTWPRQPKPEFQPWQRGPFTPSQSSVLDPRMRNLNHHWNGTKMGHWKITYVSISVHFENMQKQLLSHESFAAIEGSRPRAEAHATPPIVLLHSTTRPFSASKGT